MQTFGVIGDGVDPLLDRLRPALDGRVGVVRATRVDGGAARSRATGSTTYWLDDDGWTASGVGIGLEDALDRLAPDHDYGAAVGFPDSRLQQVALAGADPRETLLAADGPGDVDVASLAEAIDSLEPRETLESLVAEAKRSRQAERAGAIATFTGRVRARDDPGDARTEYLEFDKYEGVADERMGRIEADLSKRDGVFEVLLHHRVGVVPDGADIVFVVVLAGHRTEAFRTVEDGIDRLKDEVPLFKKEVTTDETFWVHERE